MKYSYLSLLCAYSLMLVCPAFAKAPTTPKIVFTSAHVDNYDIYIMNPDGSEQTNLTQHPAEDRLAVWSPTGEQILFVSDRGGERDLYLMNIDGSNVRRVFKDELKGSTYRDRPTWSPDGRQFAYMHINWDNDTYAIYIATLGEQAEDFIAMACFQHGRLTAERLLAPYGGELYLSMFAQVRKKGCCQGKQRLIKSRWLGRLWGTNSSLLGIRITYLQIFNLVPLYHRDGLISRQSILSIAMAPISNNLLMKLVPMHGLLSYRQTERNSFIHSLLMIGTRYLNSI